MELLSKAALSFSIAGIAFAPITPALAAELNIDTQKTVKCPDIPLEQRSVYSIHHPLTNVSITIDANNPLAAYVDVNYEPDKIKEATKGIRVSKTIPEFDQRFNILTGTSDKVASATIIYLGRNISGEPNPEDTGTIYEDTDRSPRLRRFCFYEQGLVKVLNTSAENPASIEPN